MSCSCNNKSGKNVKAYRNKHRYNSTSTSIKPTKTKEQLRQELIERMKRATGQ